MKRYHPETGELFLPYRYEDGRYRVANPALGGVKHHSKNQIAVSAAELVDYVRRGFHVRMRGVDSGQTNLIRPDEIEMSEGVAEPKPARGPLQNQESSAHPRIPPSEAPVERAKAAVEGLLPQHGRIACRRCFGEDRVIWGHTSCERDGWSIINNPMAWGNRSPRILVLGFSKGGNQNDGILESPHNEVAFRGGRANLSLILETLGLKRAHHSIDQLISDQNGDFAFGSLVRCSVKKWDGAKWLMSGKGIMSSCLRDREMGVIVENCISEFLSVLPVSVRLVVMLGNDLQYVEGCYSVIRQARPALRRINAVAYGDEQVVFSHVVHFKAQGTIVPEWATGTPGLASRPETDQPLKRNLAMEAVSLAVGRF